MIKYDQREDEIFGGKDMIKINVVLDRDIYFSPKNI